MPGTIPSSYVGISDVEVGKRETCLSCERAGKTTRLVPFGHWNVCPIHEQQLFLYVSRLNRLSEMERLIQK